MVASSSNLLLAGGLGLLIGIGGGAAGALMVERAPAPAVVGAEPGIPASVVEELTSALKSLREVLEVRANSPSTPAETRAPAADPGADRLERAVAKLAEILESPRPLPAPSVPSPAVNHRRIQPKQSPLLEELRVRNEKDRSQEFLLWSLDEVCERFGRPDALIPGENRQLTLHYGLGADHAVEFLFVDGMLHWISSN